MKTTLKISILLFMMLTSCVIYPGSSTGQNTTVGFQVFYDELSPYGQWVDYSNYGYVWIPDSESDFAPYSTNGHWILTNYGWTWSSDYSWGWATFHYGRWSFNDSFGWFWVPDNEWGPAWVNWREADGYYGWEPMQPGMNINMSFYTQYDSHNDHWLFVSNRDFERTDINHYYVNRNDHDRIVRNSTIIRNTYSDATRRATYVSGPTRNDVQNQTGRTIVPLTINESRRPGQEINNGQLRIYRPQIEKTNAGKKYTPRHVTNLKDVKKTTGRDATIQQNETPTRQPNTINQSDNNVQQPQNRIVEPTNPDRNYQPIQVPKANPVQNNQPTNRPNMVSPQRENVQPVQPQNRIIQPAPERKIQQVEPPKPVPAEINRPERQPNIQPTRDNSPQSTPQRNMNQPDNNQQRNTPPAKVENKPQPVQPQNVKPTNNRQAPARQTQSIKQEIKKEQAKEPDKVTPERK